MPKANGPRIMTWPGPKSPWLVDRLPTTIIGIRPKTTSDVTVRTGGKNASQARPGPSQRG